LCIGGVNIAKKVAAFYSIFIGICISGMWIMILLNEGISEGTIEISFHLFSEFLMAILLIIAGFDILRNRIYGKKVFLISHSMLVYSVLNAAGYYGQRSNYIMMGMFIVFLIISSVFLIQSLKKEEAV
jgi:hypothetical protein